MKNLVLDSSKLLPAAAAALAVFAIALPIMYPSHPKTSFMQTPGDVKEIRVLSNASDQGAINPARTKAQDLKHDSESQITESETSSLNKGLNSAQSVETSNSASNTESMNKPLSADLNTQGQAQKPSIPITQEKAMHSPESTIDGHTSQKGNANPITSSDHTNDISNGNVVSMGSNQSEKHSTGSDGIQTESGTKPTDMEHSTENAATDGKTQDTTATKLCYELGPIANEVQRVNVEGDLRSYGIISMLHFKTAEKNLGYWVYLPPKRSLVLARLKMEEVKLKGIKDVNVLIKEKPKFAISLGIFNDKKNANRRLLRAQSLGFDAKLKHRSIEEKQMWLTFDLDKNKDLSDEQWTEITQKNKPIQLISTKCH